jgi:hypothetical protein
MFENKFHSVGYHGTTISTARTIEAEGFKDTGNGVVCFAPLDNLPFAQRHGQRRAEEYGDQSYGVVQATFPARELEFGLGGDQINICGEDISKIAVVAILEFDTLPSGLTVARNRLVRAIGSFGNLTEF